MDFGTILFVVAVVAAGLWVALSNDKLASAIRTRFQGAKARAADALDDAIDRMEAAEADVESRLAKANVALIEVKSMRKQVENQKLAAEANVRKYETASENAASVGRRELVAEAIARKAEANTLLQTLVTQFNFLLGKEDEIAKAVEALNKRKADLKAKKVQIKTRAKTAKTVLSTNELLAGVDLTGNSKDVERAFEIVEEVEAKAGAMGEIAGSIIEKQKVEEELEALSRPQTDPAAEVEALMAKYASTEESK